MLEAAEPASSTDTKVRTQVASKSTRPPPRLKSLHSPQYDASRAPKPPLPTKASRPPVSLPESLRSFLPHLACQPPFHATIHIHAKPYLVTEGDTVRLPFLMHGVVPGDTLRLDRITILGSRDWTLRAGSKRSPETTSETPQPAEPIIGRTDGLVETQQVLSRTNEIGQMARITKVGPHAYLDDRLFTCRAVVTGVDSEPMRVMEKTKRRQRHVKHVKSKHRHTIIKIKELAIRSLAEIESEGAK
ncbi:MAG: hypothetical protein M1828_001515 [Chrysothrix sp. TS-e1954]|nr:MAG: hypothetical protein M1828_001515 [Chrysothrix sp. TS-e1954]